MTLCDCEKTESWVTSHLPLEIRVFEFVAISLLVRLREPRALFKDYHRFFLKFPSHVKPVPEFFSGAFLILYCLITELSLSLPDLQRPRDCSSSDNDVNLTIYPLSLGLHLRDNPRGSANWRKFCPGFSPLDRPIFMYHRLDHRVLDKK